MSGHTNGWIGVDLDGTLAKYDKWVSADHIGEIIPKMANRVRDWLADGKNVKIFTARIANLEHDFQDACEDAELALRTIEAWSLKHFGVVLPVTFKKDYAMIELWDDRCVQVIPNTGERADGKEET